jgi:flavin reductase (DIM6/NTAB) family NADH-FMN oxidoreductase RutF
MEKFRQPSCYVICVTVVFVYHAGGLSSAGKLVSFCSTNLKPEIVVICVGTEEEIHAYSD